MLISAALAAGSPIDRPSVVALCKPVLARRIDGDISMISADSVARHGSTTIVKGPLRALVGMGDPEPGSASTHHLIRQDYQFSCTVRSGRVRKVSITPAR